MRKFFVDTFTMIIFSIIIGAVIEMGISRLTFWQFLQARFWGTIINLLTGRIYGVFRDWIFRIFKVRKEEKIKKALVDTFAFAIFQAPLYAFVLFVAGANVYQILTACSTLTAASSFLLGRPYGIFLDFFRRFFGATEAVK